MNTEGSRLQNPEFALSVWTRLRDDDLEASKKRAQVDAMVNGEEPFDQADLVDMGQGDAYNFNDREAATIIANEHTAYMDLIAPRKLIQLKVGTGDTAQRSAYAQKICTEFSAMVRKVDTFDHYYGINARQTITHGFGVIFWQDEVDFRFKSCGWSDFKLPRDTPAVESAISIAVALIPMEISDLFDTLNVCEDVEGESCWNTNLLRSIVSSEAKKVVDTNATNNWDNWEYMERAVKENGAYFGAAMACKVWVVNFWIKEEDGTITHAMMLDPQSPTDHQNSQEATNWLYFNKSRFTNINQALITFSYETPISGTYHAARGRAWQIAPQAVAANTLKCAWADGAQAATKNLLQVVNPSQTDMDRMAVAHFGNNEVLPAGLSLLQQPARDFTKSVAPVIQMMQSDLRRNNSGARPQMEPSDSRQPAITQQLAAEDNAALSASALGRFYKSLDKVYEQMFTRAIASDYQAEDPGGPLVKEFRKELSKAGITQEILDSVYEVKAQRTIGSGSAANRLLTLNRVEAKKGSFDPEGRRNFDFDQLSEELGDNDLAARYMEPTKAEEQRQPIDVSIATFENFMFKSFQQVPALPNQDHFSHATTHLPPLMQLMDELEQRGEDVDMPYLTNLYQHLTSALPHIAQHTQFMSGDRSRIDEVKGLIQLTQQLGAASERLRNQIMRLQKAEQAAQQAEMQRQQAEQQAYVSKLEQQVQQGGAEGGKAQALLIDAQVKAKISEQEHAQRMAHREQMFNLDKAIGDAKAAAELLREAEISAKKTSSEKPPKV